MHRIAFYSHDTFGLGHLSRCIKLARAMAPVLGPAEGLFITGSPWTRLLSVPAGYGLCRLPSVVKQGATYRPRGGTARLEELIAWRRRRIVRALTELRPELLVVDNVPCGLRGEILPALRALRRLGGTRTVLALRDVLDRTRRIVGEWEAVGAGEAVQSLYDEVWVFGGPRDVRRLTRAGLLAEARVVTCGRLGTGEARQARRRGARRGRPSILVTGGGGGDAEALVETYLEMLRTLRPAVHSRVVLGPDYPPAAAARLLARNGFDASVERYVADLPASMAQSDLVVAMAGYNTVCELEGSGSRAVLVPRVWPRQEQLIRARAAERAGRAAVVEPAELAPRTLWRAIRAALESPRPEPADQPGGGVAAARTAALLGLEPLEMSA